MICLFLCVFFKENMMNHLVKSAIILFAFGILHVNLYAQVGPQFDNRGFENWTTREMASANEPVHWHSGGTASGTWSGMVSSQIESSSQTRPGSNGSKSVRLYPASVIGITANGNLTNGRMNAGSMSPTGTGNYNYTQRAESAFNTPLTQVPDSLTVWVCFRSQSTTAKAQVKAVVHGDADFKLIANGTESPANMHVAAASLSFVRTSANGASCVWKRKSIPFTNDGPCTDPRYILMTATTNETPGSGSTSDDLFLDDILLVYNPTLSLNTLTQSTYEPSDQIQLSFTLTGTMSPDNLNANANVVIAQLSDASGSFNNPTELGRIQTNTSSQLNVQIPNVTDGNQYRIRVISTNYPMIGGNIQNITIQSPTYTITTSSNPDNGGTTTGSGTYQQGQSCTITATPAAGYSFVNWTKNGTQVSTEPSYTFTVTENASYVAAFQLQSYTISTSSNPEEGGATTGGGTFDYGTSCTLTATPATGYNFVNWTKNGVQVSTNPNYSFTVTENASYVAVFQLQSYTISTSSNPNNGGTTTGGGTFDYGASCTITATPATGYGFAYWSKDGTQVSTNPNYTFTVTENASYVAVFQLQSYDISTSSNPNNGGTTTGGGTFDYGASCTITAAPATGYSFVNWTKNGIQVSTESSYTFIVTENASYVAVFQIQSYTISISSNPSNGGTTSGGGTFSFNASCTVNATPLSGFNFDNWTENGNVVSSNASYTFVVTGDRNLVANFTAIPTYNVTLTANPANGGTVDGGGTFQEGQSCTITATANEGFTFNNWTEDGDVVSSNASYTFTVTSDRNLVANFTAIPTYLINVSANPAEGGVVNGNGSYLEGQTCTVTAWPASGYVFVNWTENGSAVSSDANYSFTVTSNRTLVANFELSEIPAFTVGVSANPSNGGLVTGGGTYQEGQTCTITATANEGFIFENWTENGSVVTYDASYTLTVTNNHDFIANFMAIPTYTVIVSASPANGGLVTGGGVYQEDHSCTITAVANDGFTFVNWTENGNVIASDATYTFTVTGNRNIVANFTAIPTYTVVVAANPVIGGSVTGSGTYMEGQSCTITAMANDGFIFENWTENGIVVASDASYTLTVTSDHNLIANFTAIPTYTVAVSANPNNGGVVTGGDVYQEGYSCTITAAANDGFTFVNWTENGNVITTDTTYTFTVTRDRVFVANFAAIPTYTVVVVANPVNGGYVTGGGTYMEGQSCTVMAMAYNEYVFLNWTENGVVVSEESSYTFSVTANHELVANFFSTEGVEEKLFSWSIYPNPVRDILTIEVSEDIDLVEVYNMQGALVYTQSNCTNRIEIQTAGLAEGIYFIRLNSDNISEIKKFVKR